MVPAMRRLLAGRLGSLLQTHAPAPRCLESLVLRTAAEQPRGLACHGLWDWLTDEQGEGRLGRASAPVGYWCEASLMLMS